MQQTKEKAPCTTAIVQDAKPMSIPLNEKDTIKDQIGQLSDLTNDLECLLNVEMNDLYTVFHATVGDFINKADRTSETGRVVFYNSISYFKAAFSMLCREYERIYMDIAGINNNLGKLWQEMDGGAAK